MYCSQQPIASAMPTLPSLPAVMNFGKSKFGQLRSKFGNVSHFGSSAANNFLIFLMVLVVALAAYVGYFKYYKKVPVPMPKIPEQIQNLLHRKQLVQFGRDARSVRKA
jgi:hypothetical protein